MFFEEEDKDQPKNMDDYDLDFADDNSISWDKLLDEAEAEQIPKKPTEDDLLMEDEESFDNLLATQDLNIEEDETFVEDEPMVSFDEELDITSENYETMPQEVSDIDLDFGIPTMEEETSVDSMLEDLSDDEYSDIPEIEYVNDTVEAIAPEPFIAEPLIEQEPVYEQPEPTFQPQQAPTFEPAPEAIEPEQNEPERTPIAAPKKEKDSAAIWGGVVAALALFVIIGVGVYFYIQSQTNSDIASGDATSLLTNNDPQSADQANFDAQLNTPQQPVEPPTPPVEPAAQNAPSSPQDAPIAPKVVDKNAKKTPAQAKKATDDKKVTLKVVNTGRINPFTPVGNFNKFGFITAPRVDILEPPTQLGNLSGDLDRLLKITVSGILYDSTKPSAIINVDGIDYFVQRNDRVDDFTVAAISKETVVIKKGNNTYRANIGQNFSNGAIAGQVQRTPSRQYVSASDVNVNPQQ